METQTLYQAKPVLEVRALTPVQRLDGTWNKGFAVYVEDGTQPLFISTTVHNSWNECAAFIVGFEKAWEVKRSVCEGCDHPSDPFTEAMALMEHEGKIARLDAWQTYLLEDR